MGQNKMLISEKLQVTALVFGDCLAISQHTNVAHNTLMDTSPQAAGIYYQQLSNVAVSQYRVWCNTINCWYLFPSHLFTSSV